MSTGMPITDFFRAQDVYKRQVGTLKETAAREHITKTALILVGDAIAHNCYERSKLYDPAFTTGFRTGLADGKGEHKDEAGNY